MAGVILAAAKAAAAAALNDDINERDAQAALDAENADLTKAEARLQEVLAVNRTLHASVAKKKSALAYEKADRDRLSLLLLGRSNEEPARRSKVEGLQTQSQGHGSTSQRQRKEAERLTREMQRSEKRIEVLNSENVNLSGIHMEDREKVQEQHSRLRTLGRRERELAKQLNMLANRLNEHVDEAILNSAEGAEDGPAVDFRNLPGFCLAKLISGRTAPPPDGEAGSRYGDSACTSVAPSIAPSLAPSRPDTPDASPQSRQGHRDR